MQIDFRRSHVQRMTDSRCSPEAGLVFIDMVDNVEKIGDHLTNVAESILMDEVDIGRYAKVQRAIIDKNVVIPEGMEIGYDVEKDRRLFNVSAGGIVVVPKGMDLSEVD